MGARELGPDVGRGELDDLDLGLAELVAQGLGVGVERGLRGAVGREEGHRDVGEAGCNGHDRCVGLPDQVGAGRRSGGWARGGWSRWWPRRRLGSGRGEEVLRAHDAGVVDDGVESGDASG